MGAILGDGWYASDLAFTGHRKNYGGNPRLLVQIECELADGSRRTIVSDDHWKASYGPIQHADLLLGAEVDTRKTLAGWDQAGFDDSQWKPALVQAGSLMLCQGQADVTDTLISAIDGNRLSIKVDNDLLGGDPARDIPKQLMVDYQIGEQQTEKVLNEKQTLEIDGSVGGPALKIIKAIYGDLRSSARTVCRFKLLRPRRCGHTRSYQR